MKMYKTVLSAVEEDNYKRGVTRLDTSSGYYNASKKLNIFATIWLMLFQFAFLFGNTTALLIYTKNAKNVDMPLYFVTLVAFFVVGASLYLIRKKLHIVALALNLVAIFAQNIRIYRNDVETVNEFLNKGFLNSTRFWMYIVPGLLICLFTLIICLIGIKTRIHLVKDYKAMLEKMYDIYREKNPETSDVEWTNHLEKLDSELAEREKAKKEKEAKK